MGGLQLVLLGAMAGLAAGYGAGKLVIALWPAVREASPLPPAAAALLLLAVVGLLLGYLIQLFFDHWSVLPGALASYLVLVTPMLKEQS